ncbi:hypothetical protein GCM10009117_07860 [Gangjinia marincola]|uniref:Uncharacterized protein n=1 Tax=Gangjinia marincola TaxID=578463 RepID=A0ABP3XQQ1_9FLAO
MIVADGIAIINYQEYEILTIVLSLISYGIFNIFLFLEFKRPRIKKIDILSLSIIYIFIFWLIYMFAGIIENNADSGSETDWVFYVFMANMVILLLGSFTHYTSRSYWASMWLVVIASCAVISESAFFLTEYLIETKALKIIYIIFHLVWFYATLCYAQKRRKTNKFPLLGI